MWSELHRLKTIIERPARVFVYVHVLGMFVFAGQPSSAETRPWVKFHNQIEINGQVSAEWTKIGTVKGFPHESRMLYRDAVQRKLVIRYEVSTVDGPELFSLQSLPTGESIHFTMTESGLDVTMDGAAFHLQRGVCESYSRPDGKDCPPIVRSEAAAFIESASQSFRDTLLYFADTGCSWSLDLYGVASRLGFLFFPEQVECFEPPLDLVKQPTPPVPMFDPELVPPNEFEAQFGGSYYR